MKRLIAIVLIAFFAINTYAQTMADALRYSKNDYIGTARSLALGNAVTALGGDLGTITINPAGSAVSHFSQATFSPGFAISSNKAGYSAIAIQDPFSNEMKTNYNRMSMPNLGFNLYIDTGNHSGLTGFSMGLVMNQTRNFINEMSTGGRNNATSLLGSFANLASTRDNGHGFLSADLANENAYFNGIPWDVALAFQSGMISGYGEYDGNYIGATEKITSIEDPANPGQYFEQIKLGGPLNQNYGEKSYGNKYDTAINLGFNFEDIFQIGFNLGFTSFEYNYDKYMTESAVNKEDFPVGFVNNDGGTTTTWFSDAKYSHSYDARGNGVYAKLGFILTPVKFIRLGAAIQTPTSLEINERWMSSGHTFFSNSDYDAFAQTPRGDFTYRLKNPYRANFGAAITFSQYGLFSIDYEYCDYSTMKFKNKRGEMGNDFHIVNDEIKMRMGSSHMLRCGLELKPIPSIAMRGGFNLTTSPEHYFDAANVKHKSDAKEYSYSLGIGYSSKGSFFTDLAVRWINRFDEYISPYGDYIFDGDGNLEIPSPEIKSSKRLCDVVWTLGFRF